MLLIVLLALMSGHRLLGQEPTPAVRGPPAWVAVLLTEAMAFGAGCASTLDAAGDEGVGITYGVAGSVTLALPLLAGERPEFLLPYGIGLLTLAYYNLRFGDTRSDIWKL